MQIKVNRFRRGYAIISPLQKARAERFEGSAQKWYLTIPEKSASNVSKITTSDLEIIFSKLIPSPVKYNNLGILLVSSA